MEKIIREAYDLQTKQQLVGRVRMALFEGERFKLLDRVWRVKAVGGKPRQAKLAPAG